MSLQLYSQIPGTQVKRDANLSNATIQCDPSALYPLGATQGGVLLNKENLAGALAVEHDLCNLDVNNLTVNGALKVKGPAEVCNIVCPVDFTVIARDDIGLEAVNGMLLVAGQDMTLDSGRDMSLNAENQLKLAGNTQGVQMAFDAATDTDVLRMTQANGTVAEAQAGDVNGVCGKLVFSLTLNLAANSRTTVPIPNDKVTVNSVVIVTMDTQPLAVADLVISNVSNISNGGYDLEFGNVTGGVINIQNVIIQYLVINPAI